MAKKVVKFPKKGGAKEPPPPPEEVESLCCSECEGDLFYLNLETVCGERKIVALECANEECGSISHFDIMKNQRRMASDFISDIEGLLKNASELLEELTALRELTQNEKGDENNVDDNAGDGS